MSTASLAGVRPYILLLLQPAFGGCRIWIPRKVREIHTEQTKQEMQNTAYNIAVSTWNTIMALIHHEAGCEGRYGLVSKTAPCIRIFKETSFDAMGLAVPFRHAVGGLVAVNEPGAATYADELWSQEERRVGVP
ncbi:hypothetical protein BC835DRAFT_120392 [Cytidiella melzeri]|nr:hypothetical protein BC835DRAFT_120392 [Cytidiella melzeri]